MNGKKEKKEKDVGRKEKKESCQLIYLFFTPYQHFRVYLNLKCTSDCKNKYVCD